MSNIEWNMLRCNGNPFPYRIVAGRRHHTASSSLLRFTNFNGAMIWSHNNPPFFLTVKSYLDWQAWWRFGRQKIVRSTGFDDLWTWSLILTQKLGVNYAFRNVTFLTACMHHAAVLYPTFPHQSIYLVTFPIFSYFTIVEQKQINSLNVNNYLDVTIKTR